MFPVHPIAVIDAHSYIIRCHNQRCSRYFYDTPINDVV